MHTRLLFLTVFFFAVLSPHPSLAQGGDTIEPNPDAVLLRRIWTVMGQNEGDFVGLGAGSVGDINRDGLGDFAVRFGEEAQWKVFLGATDGPATEPYWTLDSSVTTNFSSLLVGDFWGTGNKAVGFLSYRPGIDTNNISDFHYRLFLFRTDDKTLPDTAAIIWDQNLTVTPPRFVNPTSILASDLDGDGDDELVFAFDVIRFEGESRSTVGEIWIYEGGENFQVDTPTLIIRDTEENNDRGFYPVIADFDGDGFTDLALSSRYVDVPKVKFWWGTNASPWNWTLPDDIIQLHDQIGINTGFVPHDLDGDSIPDLAGTVYGNSPTAGAYLYLSRSGKNIRDRSFTLSNADLFFQTTDLHTFNFRFGYLNDSLRRFEMFGITGLAPSQQGSVVYLFSGGKNGPNKTYDAYYATELDGLPPGNVFQYGGPVGDVNGDGWDDILATYPRWGRDHGIAVILTGGSYIPTDDQTTDVREVMIADEQGKFYVWPNPVKNVLSIAWPGNLTRMPSRFELYDLSGELIAQENATHSADLLLWNCEDIASGTYFLIAFDSNHSVLATTHVIKQ